MAMEPFKLKLPPSAESTPVDKMAIIDEEARKTGPGIRQILDAERTPMMLQNEQRTLNRLRAMHKEGLDAKREYTREWDNHIDYYRHGHIWKRERPSYRESAVMHFTQQLIERKAALLTDTKPIIKIVPSIGDNAPETLRKKYEDAAQSIEKLIENFWLEHNLDMRLARLATYAQVLGGAGTNTCIDRDRGKYGPDPTFFVIDPRHIGFDPSVYLSEELHRCEYLFTDDVRSTDWLKDRYRDKVPASVIDRIKPSARFAATDLDGPGGLLQKFRKMFRGVMGGEALSSAIDRSQVTEYWIRDYQLTPDEQRMFPNGRHIITVNDDVVLIDQPNPYDDGQFPIDFVEWHFDLDTIWGISDIDLYRNPQNLINKFMAIMAESASLMSNQIWIGDTDAMSPTQWKQLDSQPGRKVQIRTGRRLDRIAPPPLPNGLFNLMNFLMGGMEKLSGLGEVMEGRRPGQVTAGVAIESLQQAAQVVIRMKARQLECLMRRVGQKLLSRIFQYVTEDRILTVTGDGEQMLAYHYVAKKIKETPNGYQDFTFTIVPGSSLSQSKWQKGLLAQQLFALGLLDEKAVLDAMEYPDRESIIDRINKQKAAELNQMIMLQSMGGSRQSMPGQAKNRGTGGGPGGRRFGQLPKTNLRSPDTLSQLPVTGAPDVAKGGSQ